MAAHGVLERIVWFDARIRAGRFPNARDLAGHFELSPRTAQRDIDFFRDRVGAPLRYEPARRGYRYGEGAFQLPLLWVSQYQLLALLLARRMLHGGAPLAAGIEALTDRLRPAATGCRLDRQALECCVSACWSAYAPADPLVFHAVLEALAGRRLLEIRYRSPWKGSGERVGRRSVEPHHLQCYQGEWVLLAWCRTRGDWRKFMLARVVAARPGAGGFSPRPPEQWRGQLEGAFGIFQGGPLREVHLRFAPARARAIREQVWHPDQRFVPRPDGSLDLFLPVADLREIRLKVLQFGSEVEALAPPDLRAEIAAEARRMVARYGKRAQSDPF
jgi:predicted DNA-binding transcriptional regulator YafY